MPMHAQRLSLPPAVERLYPFSTRQLEVGDEQMSFAEAGHAASPHMIFVHGGLTWSFVFRQAIEACAEKFHVFAPDHIGFGRSSKPAQADYHTLERHIGSLAALIETLNLERITLVLHEWGGPIGLGFATRFPQKVERIILLNTFALPVATDLRLPWQLRMLRSSAKSFASKFLLNAALRRLSAKSMSSEVLAGYNLPLEQPNGLVAPLAFARVLPATADGANARTLEDIASNLKSVTARVEIVWGKRDPLFGSPLMAYMLRDAFPNAAEPHCLPDAAHLLPEDAPVELNEILLAPFRPKPQSPKPLFNILK